VEEMSTEVGVITRQITTSHSIDNLFDYCARKFEFLTLYSKRPKRESGRDTFAADVGTALHNAVQAWAIAKADGLSKEESISQGFVELMIWYPWEWEREQSTGLRTFPMTVTLFEQIVRHPEWDLWELVRVTDKGWAVEVPFLIIHRSLGEFPIRNGGINGLLATQGKIDFIMRNRVSGLYATLDLKTTALDEDLERSEYTYSGQQTGYSNVLHAMLGIQPEQFEVIYIVAHFDMQQIPTVNFFPLKRDSDIVDDYWLGKMERLQRMKAFAMNGWFPRTNGGCHTWGKECFFFDICESRNYDTINAWFEGINTEEQQGYDYWVTMEI
jgi:hypothetical protein